MKAARYPHVFEISDSLYFSKRKKIHCIGLDPQVQYHTILEQSFCTMLVKRGKVDLESPVVFCCSVNSFLCVQHILACLVIR